MNRAKAIKIVLRIFGGGIIITSSYYYNLKLKSPFHIRRVRHNKFSKQMNESTLNDPYLDINLFTYLIWNEHS